MRVAVVCERAAYGLRLARYATGESLPVCTCRHLLLPFLSF